MRVLITRPEREATTLATALAERGHVPVIAPLFRLEILHPPATFATDLADCQAILLSSANGARALAEASEQRGKPILAVGDTTASTAEGLGFVSVASAAGDGRALAELARKRLDPRPGLSSMYPASTSPRISPPPSPLTGSRCVAWPCTTPARRPLCRIRLAPRSRRGRSTSRCSFRRAPRICSRAWCSRPALPRRCRTSLPSASARRRSRL